MTIDEAFAKAKEFIWATFDRETIHAIYDNVYKRELSCDVSVLYYAQNILISEAEKYAKECPIYSLALLTYTTHNHLSTVDFYRRNSILDYCLVKVSFETVSAFPNWIVCRWKHLMAREQEKFYINVDHGIKLILKRETKTIDWDVLLVVNKKVVDTTKVRLYVLSKYRFNYNIQKTDDGYIIPLDTPYIAYEFCIRNNKLEVKERERHNQTA